MVNIIWRMLYVVRTTRLVVDAENPCSGEYWIAFTKTCLIYFIPTRPVQVFNAMHLSDYWHQTRFIVNSVVSAYKVIVDK